MEKFEFKKSLGQNFINDDNIIKKIISFSGIDKNKLVIEIGAGAGSLSKEIVPISGYSLLYEIDERLKSTLNDVLSDYSNYQIIFDDFLKQDLKSIRKKYENKEIYVIANLPYYITTPIITKLLKEIYPDKMIIMIQEEVADRLSATFGTRNYGMISVLLNAKYEIKKLFKVSRNCFIPKPNVDSAVIMLDKNDKMKNVDASKFEKLIKEAFQFKRKNLRNNLKKYDLLIIEKILNKYNFDLNCRAEDLPVKIFIEIAKNI